MAEVPSTSQSQKSPWHLLLFWVYAVALVLGVRTVAHYTLTGWAAKLSTMGGIAVGLLPWGHWLRPRIVRVLGLVGRAALVVCYVVLLLPIALIMRFFSDPLRRRRPAAGSSQWIARPPLPNTLDAAHLEY